MNQGQEQVEIVGGLDVGNGYVKGMLQAPLTGVDRIDMPSAVAVVNRPQRMPEEDQNAPVTLLPAEPAAVTGLYNELEASFETDLVPDQYRRLFGTRSLQSGATVEEFDVVSPISKAEQPLSHVLVLGTLALKGLREHLAGHPGQGLPTQVQVQARVCLALPIEEYVKHRSTYVEVLKKGVHTVVVRNFATPVSVQIEMADVYVLPEGTPAQYAIVDMGEPLMEKLLEDVRSRGVELSGVTAWDVLSAGSTLGIDIGEGTVNFPVFRDRKFNPDASTSFDRGYGSVLNDALESMDASGDGAGFSSRKQLGDFLKSQPSPLKRAMHQRVTAHVDEEMKFFADKVVDKFGELLVRVGSSIEVVYVYGGGSAGRMRELLYPALVAKVASVLGPDGPPVMYLDASYSRDLNRKGLFLAASARANQARAAAGRQD